VNLITKIDKTPVAYWSTIRRALTEELLI
jgi:hypothetical protein